MIGKDEAIAKFKEIIGAKADWAYLIKSQFVRMLSVFQSWALREALWKVERAVQEFFLSTALNRSSILAHAEDREYIPRKPEPATGTVAITNNGAAAFSVPINQPFVSDGDVDYSTVEAVEVGPGETKTIKFKQLVKEEIAHTVTEEKAFYEILFARELTYKISDIDVSVDLGEGEGFEDWEYARLFQNALAASKVYDEFFSHNDQVGVRFGNGIFGAIPPAGAQVKIILRLTDGDTALIPKQPLHLVGELLDFNQDPVDLKAETATAINEGQAAETIEEIRTNLHYWPIYNEQLVWQEDYAFFIMRKFPEITWLRVWGEEEQEAAHGASLGNINKIWVSAYRPGDADLGEAVIAHLSTVRLLNRKFAWVTPLETTFHLSITGKVAKTKTINTVIADIRTKLSTNYGKDSSARLHDVAVKDIYRMINNTGHFDNAKAYFEVAVTGIVASTALNEMNCIDMDSTAISLDYV